MRIILSILLFITLQSEGQIINASQPYRPFYTNQIEYITGVGAASTNATDATTNSVNSTGASIIIIAVSSYKNTSPPVLSDNKSNTYSLITSYTSDEYSRISLYACLLPNVGSGHTFSVSGTTTYPSLYALCFSGITEIGASTNNNKGVSPLNSNSITTDNSRSLIISAFSSNYNNSVSSVTADFIHYDLASIWNAAFFTCVAYKISNSIETIGCEFTWTPSVMVSSAAIITHFK